MSDAGNGEYLRGDEYLRGGEYLRGSGRPPAELRRVTSMARAYYAKPGNEAGGHLHIVVDDYNVGDDNVQFCIAQARRHGDTDGVELGEELLKLSQSQRLIVAEEA